jgi:N-acetylmuramoyl-L-alanine amidase
MLTAVSRLPLFRHGHSLQPFFCGGVCVVVTFTPVANGCHVTRPLLLLNVVLLAFATAAGPARAETADDAYAAAKDALGKLKKDEQRRKLRHHWQNVEKKFDAVAAKYGKSDRAPEAIFMAGELDNELSRFSQKADDVDAAREHYRRLLEGWPKHRLADDAALALAKLLAEHDDEPQAARRVLEAALTQANDKKKELAALLASLPKEKVKKAPPPDKANKPAPKVELADHKPAERHEPSVADAIRRAVKPLEALHLPPAEAPPVQARHVPAARPEIEPETAKEEVAQDDSDAQSPIATLQEKLRDVRIGARPPPEDPKLRSQFKQLAKDEPGNEVSLAQQLGLKVRRVVIDAGHGGHDTGAIGLNGTREKDIALAIALKLAAKLRATGLEVVLTRDDDTFVKLEERTAIANQQKGDLFISVHCNAAASRTLRGIETYTLNTSSNRYSIRLAARENATTERGVGDLQYILADLATKANTGESTRLAERVQRTLVRDLGAAHKNVRDLGTKEALFFVLLGAKMPSILVETSFISNPEEELRLGDEGYQQSVASSIAESVSGFLEERNKLAQVD